MTTFGVNISLPNASLSREDVQKTLEQIRDAHNQLEASRKNLLEAYAKANCPLQEGDWYESLLDPGLVMQLIYVSVMLRDGHTLTEDLYLVGIIVKSPSPRFHVRGRQGMLFKNIRPVPKEFHYEDPLKYEDPPKSH
jgi:hypothetical protein